MGRKILGVMDRVDSKHRISEWFTSTFSQPGIHSQGRHSQSSGGNSRGSPRRQSMKSSAAQSAAVSAAAMAATDSREIGNSDSPIPSVPSVSSQRNQLFKSLTSSKKEKASAVNGSGLPSETEINANGAAAAAVHLGDEVILFNAVDELDETVDDRVHYKSGAKCDITKVVPIEEKNSSD